MFDMAKEVEELKAKIKAGTPAAIATLRELAEVIGEENTDGKDAEVGTARGGEGVRSEPAAQSECRRRGIDSTGRGRGLMDKDKFWAHALHELAGVAIDRMRTAVNWMNAAHHNQYSPSIMDWPQRIWVKADDGTSALYVLERGDKRR